MLTRLVYRIARFDAHQRLLAGLFCAAVASFVIPKGVPFPAHITTVWVVYALVELILCWVSILMLHPRDLPRLSQLQDSSRTLILIFVVAASMASLFAVIVLLNSVDRDRQEHVFLPVLAVASAWGLVHTIFTLRYAHLYYGVNTRHEKRGGGAGLSS